MHLEQYWFVILLTHKSFSSVIDYNFVTLPKMLMCDFDISAKQIEPKLEMNY